MFLVFLLCVCDQSHCTMTDNDDGKQFSHVFSGISVWLEPDPSQTYLLAKEMGVLAEKFGGRDSGVHRFMPHCTLLYNTSFPSSGGGRSQIIESNGEFEDGGEMRRRLVGEDILRKCLSEYRCLLDDRNIAQNEPPVIKLIPTSPYYFPYPKMADNGKGFGCAISLLILETSPGLELLQNVVKKSFPPDERHGGGRGNVQNTATSEEEHDECCDRALEEDVELFRPHITLIYAPEQHEHVTDGWLEDYTTKMDVRAMRFSHGVNADECDSNSGNVAAESYDIAIAAAEDANATHQDERMQQRSPASWNARYISIWSTEGTLDEWFSIAKLDLFSTSSWTW